MHSAMSAHLCEIAGGLAAAIVCEGDVTGHDLYVCTQQLLHWDDARLHKLVAGLVDQSRASAFEVPAGGVEKLVELDMRLAQKVRAGYIVAVAAPRDLQFGLSRMWQTLAEATGWEIRVFRTEAEAVDWMRARASQKFDVELPHIPTTAL